ncbi:hypothetical protein [Aminipila terrae]|uniref:Uncharacterized protein n=1 Tax=Aminipila terrae TaxID=2697030 RepID=A0A6P1MP50_9FIRM|nr:hypothetical protein [Aminipila terrae]QHI73456.1 hypothetical protein Ami3637_14685 [Aminipila terrae]
MEIIIKQSKLKYNYEYKIYSQSNLLLLGKANRTIFPSKRKIEISYPNGNIVCTLKQENDFKYILSCIPIINLLKICACPYILYFNNQNKGYFMQQGFWNRDIVGIIGNNKIAIKAHTGNYISIHFNNEQVALAKKNVYKKFDADEYLVNYNKDQRMEVISIIYILVDIIWYTSDDTLYSNSLEYKIVFNDDFNKNWKAK